jgi:hypothetical protein
MPDDQDTFVLRPGLLRIILLPILLVLGSVMFLFMAAIAVAIKVDSAVARLALMLLALLLSALAVYCLLSLRTCIVRIEVGPQRLKLRIPRMRGPLPLFGTIRAELPYAAIAAVEAREEVYDTFGLVTVLHAYSIVTRDGARILLGVMAENWGVQLPYDRAAALIAARARVALTDRGAVRVGGILRAMIRDVPPWNTAAIPAVERSAWQRRGALTMQIVLLLVAVIALLHACSQS